MTALLRERHFTFRGLISSKTYFDINKLFRLQRRSENHGPTLQFLKNSIDGGPSENSDKLTSFVEFAMSPSVKGIFKYAADFYKGVKDSSTHDPYFKHSFYTAFLARELTKDSAFPDEVRIITATSLLHDALIIRRQKKPNFSLRQMYGDLEKMNLIVNERRKILMIIVLNPPEVTMNKPSRLDWLKGEFDMFNLLTNDLTVSWIQKRFEILFPIDGQLSDSEALEIKKIVQGIKIANEIARLRETTYDISEGRIDLNKQIGIDFSWRITDFRAKMERIELMRVNSPVFIKAREDLIFLEDFQQHTVPQA